MDNIHRIVFNLFYKESLVQTEQKQPKGDEVKATLSLSFLHVPSDDIYTEVSPEHAVIYTTVKKCFLKN